MIINRDTREQLGFDFFTQGVKVEDTALSAGDYTIFGLEKYIAIERKASTGELSGNLGKIKMRERFYRELEKLDTIQEAYIVCEFPESYLYTFPENSGIPRSKRKFMKMSSKYLRKLIHEVEDNFKVEFIYCDDRNHAEQVTYGLLEAAWNKYGNIPQQ